MARTPKATKQIVYTKSYRGREQSPSEYAVEIVKGKSVTVFNIAKGSTITFEIGDTAEYDSYNMSYTGEIVAITDKTVTIWTGWYRNNGGTSSHDTSGEGKKEVRRLDLHTFCWRNYDYDAEKIQRRNYEAMMNT